MVLVKVQALFRQAQWLVQTLGLRLQRSSTGGSAGNLIAALSVATPDDLGSTGTGEHPRRLCCGAADAGARAALLSGLLLSL